MMHGPINIRFEILMHLFSFTIEIVGGVSIRRFIVITPVEEG